MEDGCLGDIDMTCGRHCMNIGVGNLGHGVEVLTPDSPEDLRLTRVAFAVRNFALALY